MRDYRWIDTERGRSFVTSIGKAKHLDISITKFKVVTKEVGGAHSTDNDRDNITLFRKGALL